MKTITVNFDDIFLRENGNCTQYESSRSLDILANNTPYTLRVVKRNIAEKETLVVGVYDAEDLPVQDVQVIYAGTYCEIDEADHPGSVAIPLTSGSCRNVFTLTSTTLNLDVEVVVQFDQAHPEAGMSKSIASDFVLNLLDTAGKNFKTFPGSISDCPDEEQVLAYAYHELNDEDAQKIRTHVHQCLNCLDIVLAARHAEEVSDDTAAIPLPDWLTASSATVIDNSSEAQAEIIIRWKYPSVKDMVQDIRKRWGHLLDWPNDVLEFPNFEYALLAAAFKPEILPVRASDEDAERLITAKWIRLEDNCDIIDIQPTNVWIHRQMIAGNSLKVSGELPAELKQSRLTLLFGWVMPDGSILPLTLKSGGIRGGYFSKDLTAECPIDPKGKLKILVMGYAQENTSASSD